ncbi:MAG: SH3 domain-containing protein [Cyanobacteria bacterium P01_D01_bin.56]
MTSRRFNLQGFVVGLIKFICGVAIALFIIGLAGAATARYFLTQLSTLPERPVYNNDAPAAQPASAEESSSTSQLGTATATETDNGAAAQLAEAKPEQPKPDKPEAKVLFKATVTYSAGLLIRKGAGADYETVDGIDYNETIDVLEESGRWYKIRTSSGVEGWIKGRDNTRRL